MTYEDDQRKGERLQRALRLGPGAGPSTVRILNEEWQRADELGRLLLGHFAEQDKRKINIDINLNNDEGDNTDA